VPAFVKGLALAVANTFVCAAAISFADDRSAPFGNAFGLVVAYGMTPAVATGVVLGILGGLVRARRWIRLAILLPPALGVVVLLGYAFNLVPLIPLAWIPTAVGVLVLERWTRVTVPAPIPAARVA
jgi:hypothetical protein